MKKKDLLKRFNEKWTPEPNTGCWLWTASLITSGYGSIRDEKRVARTAHRVSWQLFKGPIPKGMFVCHSCDTPACVNPSHLFIGSNGENTKDMLNKNRQRSPLKKEQIVEIRSLLKVKSTIYVAKLYNVSQSTISRIKRKERWKHI